MAIATYHRGKMKGLCSTCPARPTCKALCPIALAFVKKRVGRRELLIADMDVAIQKRSDWPELTKTKKELILEMYFMDRRRQTEIAEHVGVSRPYVSKVVNVAKRKIRWLIS